MRSKTLIVLLLSTVVVWMTGAPAMAVHDTDTFELDGNPQEQVVAGDDWELIFDGGGSNFAEAFVRDWSDPTDTTYLHTGGSKDNNDFDEWVRTTTDEAPDKDEIMNAFAAAYMVGGHLVLYFGADRFDDEGDAQMGFWFTQDDVSISGTNVNGDHVDGDILVQSNFVNGGKVDEIEIYEWVGSGGSHGTLDLIADIQNADCTEVADGDPACAIVNNDENIVPVWDFDNKDGSEYNSGEFYEGGIDLTELGVTTDCFSTFIAETRTAQPFDARLKDVAMGDFDTCATKKGTKFEDLNADGDRDEGEPALENWTIHLFGEGEHLHDVTDANGNYEFGGLEPGQYTVCETKENGWTQSMPSSGADCSGHDHDGAPGPWGYAIGLDFGEIDSGNDFGNFRAAHKSGTKFEDRNGDGDRDEGEPGLAGWQIHLFGTDGAGSSVHEHDTTDADGDYSFTVSPGDYTVCETLTNGWSQSKPGSDAADCSGHTHQGAITPAPWGYSISLDSNETDSGNDFGNFRSGHKMGTKFEDVNGDGDRDEGEPGIEGWQIHLFGTSGAGDAVHVHTTTGANGAYSFDVPPGSYTVCETIPAGWDQSYPAQGADCSGHGGGVGYAITLGSDETDSGNDFGNLRSATKEGTKFEDVNGDGDRDEGEPGVEGVEIHLFGTSGAGNAVHEHDTTDPDGHYSFSVPPGSYTVCETIASGWTQSYPATGADCSAHGGGVGYAITLDSNEADAGNDFGNFRNATKEGTKIEDLNADGSLDEGEPGVEGVEVHLFGTDGMGNEVHLHAFADADGHYSFDVPPGNYTVCESIADGWTQSYPAEGADCSGHGGGIGYSITLTSNETDSGNDFGNYRQAHKLGTKFNDLNANGERDEGEPGIQGWQINLSGTDGAGNAVNQTAYTDADGNYGFTVPPGSYLVCETVGEGNDLEPGVKLVVSADPESGEPGDPVAYTYTVTNTGEVTLTDLVVTDDDLGEIGTIDALEPGESTSMTASDVLSDSAGDDDRSATVTGEDGWKQSFPSEGADCSGHGGGIGYSIDLVSDQTETGNDFGNFRRTVSANGGTSVTVVLGNRLPRTGSDVLPLMDVGVGILGIGIALSVIARRRERRGIEEA